MNRLLEIIKENPDVTDRILALRQYVADQPQFSPIMHTYINAIQKVMLRRSVLERSHNSFYAWLSQAQQN
jgi:hypothetical protein